MVISTLQAEKDSMKEFINSLESAIAVKDRDLIRLTDSIEEEREKIQRELR
jgi:predicted  nucleic acid-binding Zn-ribbon protein